MKSQDIIPGKNNYSIDIYIPKYKVGVELDGGHWHKGRKKEIRDRHKGEKAREMGVTLFRVRDKRYLNRISSTDVFYNEDESNLLIIKRCLKNLMKYVPFTFQDKTHILNYMKTKTFQNVSEYERLLAFLPGPSPEKSLATVDLQLAEQWHPTKNGRLKPTQVSSDSSRKVWWLCNKGHEWRAVIQSRRIGQDRRGQCPYVLSRKIGEDNNLAFLHPKIVEQWHPTKNGDLKPSDLAPKTNRKVWWLCDKGHEWKATIASRVTGRSCQECYFNRMGEQRRLEAVRRGDSLAVFIDKNKEEYSHLLDEWDNEGNELTPNDLSPRSSIRVWWKCKNWHKWKTTVGKRVGTKKTFPKGTNCPECYNQKRSEHSRK